MIPPLRTVIDVITVFSAINFQQGDETNFLGSNKDCRYKTKLVGKSHCTIETSISRSFLA